MRFGEKLSRWIESTGISANEVARRVGVSPMTVGRWREGAIEPRRDELVRTARLMGADLGWLADDAQDALPQPDPDEQELAMLVRRLGAAEAVRRILGATSPRQAVRAEYLDEHGIPTVTAPAAVASTPPPPAANHVQAVATVRKSPPARRRKAN